MDLEQNIIGVLFIMVLVVNALLFTPQIIYILRRKTDQALSTLTLGGWIFMQLTLLYYGIVNQNYLLAISGVFSLLTCVIMVVLSLRYRESECSSADIGLADILEQLPGYIYWKDKQGVYLGGNKNCRHNFGSLSLNDFIGKMDKDLLSQQDADVISV